MEGQGSIGYWDVVQWQQGAIKHPCWCLGSLMDSSLSLAKYHPEHLHSSLGLALAHLGHCGDAADSIFETLLAALKYTLARSSSLWCISETPGVFQPISQYPMPPLHSLSHRFFLGLGGPSCKPYKYHYSESPLMYSKRAVHIMYMYIQYCTKHILYTEWTTALNLSTRAQTVVCRAWHCPVLLHITAMYFCTALHCTAPHCTALHFTAMHCTSAHRNPYDSRATGALLSSKPLQLTLDNKRKITEKNAVFIDLFLFCMTSGVGWVWGSGLS